VYVGNNTFTGDPYLIDLNAPTVESIPELANANIKLINNNWLVWREGMQLKTSYAAPGVLKAMNLQDRQILTLADQGVIAASLPDGRLIIRTGWTDGPIQSISPPFDKSLVTIVPSGPWTEQWSLSPDKHWLAWIELEIDRNYYAALEKDYLPDIVESPPKPWGIAVAFWNADTNEFKRFPINGATWPYNDLIWSIDSKSVLFQQSTADPREGMSLARLSLDGHSEVLATYPFVGAITPIAESSNGSVYFRVGEKSIVDIQHMDRPLNETKIVKVNPVGARTDIFVGWFDGQISLDHKVLMLKGYNNNKNWLIDTQTGVKTLASPPGTCDEQLNYSPNLKWVLHRNCDPATITSVH
jgi:hypothetical protein